MSILKVLHEALVQFNDILGLFVKKITKFLKITQSIEDDSINSLKDLPLNREQRRSNKNISDKQRRDWR